MKDNQRLSPVDGKEYRRGNVLTQSLSPTQELSRLIRTNTKLTDTKPTVVARFCTLVSLGDSIRSATKTCGIKYSRGLTWSHKDWFQEAQHILRTVNNNSLDTKFSGILDEAQDLILDALRNGDKKRTKDGTEWRAPVCARDASIISGIAFDKRQLLRGEPTQIADEGAVEDKLEMLMDRFTEIAEGNAKKNLLIEGEVVDAEYEEL